MTAKPTASLKMIEEFTENPAATALLLDIDGTLAGITEDPADTVVDSDVVETLTRLAGSYGLVGLVTGRALDRSHEMLGTDAFPVAAVHGMHVRWPDGEEWLDPAAEQARPQLEIAVQMAQTVGWRYEDKQASVALHFRHMADPEATARQMKSQILTVLDPRVVSIHDAKQAVEIRPHSGSNKGDAVERLVSRANGISRVLYAGDDMTDIDAFSRLDALAVDTLKVAVGSDETPAEVTDPADVTIDGVVGMHEVLRHLAARV